MVDVQWQGFSAAKKVADLAESYELNVAPHNYNGHLSTFQSLNLCASVSNVKIMESDPEHTPWRDELVTVLPTITGGMMRIPEGPRLGHRAERVGRPQARVGRLRMRVIGVAVALALVETMRYSPSPERRSR